MKCCLCNLSSQYTVGIFLWVNVTFIGWVDKSCLLMISICILIGFELTISSFKIRTWYLRQSKTILLVALSAGTKTNDSPNSFYLCLILVTNKCYTWLGMKLLSNYVIRIFAMFINLVIKLLKDVFINTIPLVSLITIKTSTDDITTVFQLILERGWYVGSFCSKRLFSLYLTIFKSPVATLPHGWYMNL